MSDKAIQKGLEVTVEYPAHTVVLTITPKDGAPFPTSLANNSREKISKTIQKLYEAILEVKK